MHTSIHGRPRWPAGLAAVLLAGLAVTGCGGSSGGGASMGGSNPPGGTPVTTKSGPLTFSASIALPPVTIGGRNAVVFGFAGGSITNATAKLPPLNSTNLPAALGNTLIAYDENGQTRIFNYGTGTSFPIGEAIGPQFSTSPSFSGVGNRLAVAQQAADGQTNQVFLENLDGSSRVGVGTAFSSLSLNPSPAYSPDGSKVAYLLADTNGQTRLALVNVSGGNSTFITDGTDVPANPVWSPDGTKIVYADLAAGATTWSIKSFAVSNGGLPLPFIDSLPGTAPVVTFLGGDPQDLVVSFTSGGQTFFDRYRNGSRLLLFNNGDTYRGISGSPIGKFLLIGDTTTNSINLLDADAPVPTPVPLIFGNVPVRSPNWGPYLTSKALLGPGGAFGPSAGAILYSTVGPTVGGLIAVDAVTRSSISVQPGGNANPTQSVIFATVTGPDLTSLKYMNGLNGAVVTAFSGANPSVAGALVSFNADTGNVVSVVTFGASLAKAAKDGSVYTGKILGAFDATGKNIAPNGARRVSFDAKSGRLLSAQ